MYVFLTYVCCTAMEKHTKSCKRTALFCVVMQWVVVILFWCFGTTYQSHLQGSPEYGTLLRNYYYSVHTNPEECCCHMLCGRNLNSRKMIQSLRYSL